MAGEDTPEIEQLPSMKRLLDETSRGMRNQNKIRKGHYIADSNPCPEEVAAVLQRAEQHLKMREAAIGAEAAFDHEGTKMVTEDRPSVEELAEEEDEADEEAEIEMVAERIAAELE